MKKLDVYQELNNSKIIKKYSDNIILLESNIIKYICKRVIIPFSKKELQSQHEFIKFLIYNKINVASIINLFSIDGSVYELQEFIDGNFEIPIEKLIEFIAKFHQVSIKYNGNLYKKNIYKINFQCKGSNLEYILLGFKEKFYEYPLKNFQLNKNLIYQKNQKYINNLLFIYEIAYKKFIKSYDICSCIIHNDIISNNVIYCKKQIFLIDFDLCIKSSEYVDFVDAILKKYTSLEYIIQNFNKMIKEIKKLILVYNQYNEVTKLDLQGVELMIILKLISFYFYVMLNKNNREMFNNNIGKIYKICSKILMMEEMKND